MSAQTTITAVAYLALSAHLEAAYPHEGAGLLLGKADRIDRAITSVLTLPNRWDDAEQYHRFLLTPQDMLAGEHEAARRSTRRPVAASTSSASSTRIPTIRPSPRASTATGRCPGTSTPSRASATAGSTTPAPGGSATIAPATPKTRSPSLANLKGHHDHHPHPHSTAPVHRRPGRDRRRGNKRIDGTRRPRRAVSRPAWPPVH